MLSIIREIGDPRSISVLHLLSPPSPKKKVHSLWFFAAVVVLSHGNLIIQSIQTSCGSSETWVMMSNIELMKIADASSRNYATIGPASGSSWRKWMMQRKFGPLLIRSRIRARSWQWKKLFTVSENGRIWSTCPARRCAGLLLLRRSIHVYRCLRIGVISIPQNAVEAELA